jgi:hypothetical protein
MNWFSSTIKETGMRKLLTRAIAAGALLVAFSVYGDTSNLVFYSDFENSEDDQPIITLADLNGATLAPPSVFDQTPPNGWVALSLHRVPANSNGRFRQGAASQVAYIAMTKNATGLSATMAYPAPFTGVSAVRFSYDFQPNSGNRGTAQIITGYDNNNNSVFTIKMNSIAGSPQYLVSVNDESIGYAFRSGNSANPLNSISLLLDSTGITVTLINSSTLETITKYGIPPKNGFTQLSRFKLESEKNLASNFDYDNFQVWAISKVPPPPRLDLYIITP